MPNNISILSDADFRYVRAIADIIVTDSNYSTLGWCLIKEIPLIYLMSKKCNPLLSDQLEDLFIESFFVVDFDLNGWELKLKQLLDIPMKNLQIKWNEKKAKRASLVKKYIHGPNHYSSIIAANFIERHL